MRSPVLVCVCLQHREHTRIIKVITLASKRGDVWSGGVRAKWPQTWEEWKRVK